jgi:hypothetical protein
MRVVELKKTLTNIGGLAMIRGYEIIKCHPGLLKRKLPGRGDLFSGPGAEALGKSA